MLYKIIVVLMILTMSCASIPQWESDTDRPNSEEKRKKTKKRNEKPPVERM